MTLPSSVIAGILTNKNDYSTPVFFNDSGMPVLRAGVFNEKATLFQSLALNESIGVLKAPNGLEITTTKLQFASDDPEANVLAISCSSRDYQFVFGKFADRLLEAYEQDGCSIENLKKTLVAFKDFFASPTLSSDEEQGLLFELMAMKAIFEIMPIETAVEGWMGPEAGVWDFDFPEGNIVERLEIKSSKTGRSSITVNGSSQLEGGDGRRVLLVVDCFIGATGSSLSEEVEDVRRLIGDKPRVLERFEEKLKLRMPKTSDLGQARWNVRGVSLFDVDRSFPSVANALNLSLVGGRVSGVEYVLSLSGLSKRSFKSMKEVVFE